MIESNIWFFVTTAFYLWHALVYLLGVEEERIFETAVVQYDGEKFEYGYAMKSGRCRKRSEKVGRWSPLGNIVFCALAEGFTFELLSTVPEESFREWVNSCFPPEAEFTNTYDGWVLNISASERSAHYGDCLNATDRIFPLLDSPKFPGSIKTVYYINHDDGLSLFSVLSKFKNGFKSSDYSHWAENGDSSFCGCVGYVRFILSAL